MRWPSAWLTVCSAIVLAGCGGGAEERTATPAPRIERPVAERLAALSDEVAARLEAEDACGAGDSAGELTTAAIAAINDRKVPTPYLEDFLGAVNELEAQIPRCAGPPPPPAEGKQKDGDERGKGKGKGKEKRDEDEKDKDGGDDD